MSEKDILGKLSAAVQSFDADLAANAAKDAVDAKINPVTAIEKGLAVGLREIGDKFESGELWLPHLVLGAEAMEAAIKVLKEHMPKSELESTSKGTVVIGTVEGDIHDLGLRIVASMLRANGFKVYDLGCDTPSMNFITKAKEVDADIIALSSLMTTTMPFMRDILDALNSAGDREKYKVLIGGGPVTKEWAQTIGADAYGKDAAEAVRVAKDLLARG